MLIAVGRIHQLVAVLDVAGPLASAFRSRNSVTVSVTSLPSRCRRGAPGRAPGDRARWPVRPSPSGGSARDLAAAQQGADALDQQALRERLLDVVVGAHAQAQHLVDLVVLRGEEDDRHGRRLRRRDSSSMPSMRGILMSRTARSTGCAVNPRNASAPSVKLRTVKPSASSAMDTEVRMFRSSSTRAMVRQEVRSDRSRARASRSAPDGKGATGSPIQPRMSFQTVSAWRSRSSMCQPSG
jgi:hypothetical protein